MANLVLNISRGTQTFASRARRKAGMGSFFATVPTPPLPAQGVFSRGLSAYFSKPGGPLPPSGIFSRVAVGMNSFMSDPVNRPLPAPSVFAPIARGMRSFFSRPQQTPPLPAPSVFAPLASPHDCGSCRKRCFRRRGMGQAELMDLTPTSLGDTLVFPSSPASSISTSTPPFTLNPSSNPALDAYNQALTNAMANNPALASSSNLSKWGPAAAVASPAQLQSATNALNASATTGPGLTQQISAWLGASTLINGVPNSTVAFGGAAAVVLLGVLASKKKGRR
jgi:hypothetical protein